MKNLHPITKMAFLVIIILAILLVMDYVIYQRQTPVQLEPTPDILSSPAPAPEPTQPQPEPVTTPQQAVVQFENGHMITVAIAQTTEELTTGLSGLESLPDDQGMLFVFNEPVIPIFWMKGMNFPLDVLWVRDGRVVGILENIQHEPGVPDNQLTQYKPSAAIDMVLEVNAGFVARRGGQEAFLNTTIDIQEL